MRSSFIGMLGAPKIDLRKKYHCTLCGERITVKNFGMSSTEFKANGWSGVKVYCKGCYLTEAALEKES